MRAGIEALGVAGRSPSVEELNGEGSPYSPYILRRRELIEPMNLPSARGAAMPPAPAGAAGPPAQASPPTRVPTGGPLVDPAAAARIAAVAVQAQEVAHARTPQPATSSVPAGPVGGSTVSIRADVPSPEAAQPPGAPRPSGAPRDRGQDTVALPVEPAPTRAGGPSDPGAITPVPGPRTLPDDTGGLGGLFAATATETRHYDRPAEQQGPLAGGSSGWNPSRRGSSALAAPPAAPAPARRRVPVLVVAALVLVLAVGVGGWLLLRSPGTGGSAGPAAVAPGAASAGSSGSAPAVGDTRQIAGVTYTLQAGTVERSCRGHAYGSVSGFFAGRDCLELSRALWSADVDGTPAVVALSRVEMPDATTATALRQLADGNGTGNVSDLLREGVSYRGAPARLSSAQYASAQDGATVTIVETSWVKPRSGSSAELDDLADHALTLPAAEATGTAGK